MLFIAFALLFAWLALRELFGGLRSDRPDPIYWPYLLLVTGLAIACAWPPLGIWRFERMLERQALILTEGRPVSVHCNTLLDTMFDRHSLAAAHANPETGEIVFQKPWCELLRDYLDDPEDADERELASLNLFTHEAMHIRGEMSEPVTECQAVQRNHLAARLLGVPEALAEEHAVRYFREVYALREQYGAFAAQYHSTECRPGGALDERLAGAVWMQEAPGRP